jgi:hypothetical protein
MALCNVCGGFEYSAGTCAWPHTPEAIANNKRIWEANTATAERRTAAADADQRSGIAPRLGTPEPPSDAVGHRLSPSDALAGMISKRYRKRSGLPAEDPETSDEIHTGTSPALQQRERERAMAPKITHPTGCRCDACLGAA